MAHLPTSIASPSTVKHEIRVRTVTASLLPSAMVGRSRIKYGERLPLRVTGGGACHPEYPAGCHGAGTGRLPGQRLYRRPAPCTSRDVSSYAGASVDIDARTGRPGRVFVEQDRSGDVVTGWLGAIHVADLKGLWFRIVVAVFGVALATIAVTGVLVWLKKRTIASRRAAVRGHTDSSRRSSIVA